MNHYQQTHAQVTVDKALRNREYTDFNDGLNSQFKFRSGTNGLNEELGSKNAM